MARPHPLEWTTLIPNPLLAIFGLWIDALCGVINRTLPRAKRGQTPERSA